MWEAVLVALVVGLIIARFADVINEILSPVVPAALGSTSLSGGRVILWIVAAILGFIAVDTLGYDMLGNLGVASGVDTIWNVLFLIALADLANNFYHGRLVRR